MDKWVVIVEVNGVDVERKTYGCLGAAQMAQESKRLDYYWHNRTGVSRVEVGIKQD
jgi:hypothetical protein